MTMISVMVVHVIQWYGDRYRMSCHVGNIGDSMAKSLTMYIVWREVFFFLYWIVVFSYSIYSIILLRYLSYLMNVFYYIVIVL